MCPSAPYHSGVAGTFFRLHRPMWLHSFRSTLRSLLFSKVSHYVLGSLVGPKHQMQKMDIFKMRVSKRGKGNSERSLLRSATMLPDVSGTLSVITREQTLHGHAIVALYLGAKFPAFPYCFKSQTPHVYFRRFKWALKTFYKYFTTPFVVFRDT